MSATSTTMSIKFIGLMCIAFGLLISTTSANELPPDKTIENAVAALASAVEPRREELRRDKRATVAVIDDFLNRYSDMRLACRIILSTSWKTATIDQRKRFMEAFNNHVTNMLIDLVPELDFDNITVVPFEGDVEELPVTVRTTVRTVEGDLLQFNFRMHNKDGDWRILDVVAEGVSYVKLYRAEFRQEISEHGLEETIERFAQRSTPK